MSLRVGLRPVPDMSTTLARSSDKNLTGTSLKRFTLFILKRFNLITSPGGGADDRCPPAPLAGRVRRLPPSPHAAAVPRRLDVAHRDGSAVRRGPGSTRGRQTGRPGT